MIIKRKLVGSQKTKDKAKELLDKINKNKEDSNQKVIEPIEEPIGESIKENVIEDDKKEVLEPDNNIDENEKVFEEVINPATYTKINKSLSLWIKCPSCGLKMKPNSLIFIMNVSSNRTDDDCRYKLVACPKKDCGVAFVIDKDYSIRGF